MANMTRKQLVAKANELKALAVVADKEGRLSDRSVLIRKARNYFEEAGLSGFARSCERWL